MARKSADVAHMPLDHPTAHQMLGSAEGAETIPEQKRAAAASARFREDDEMDVPDLDDDEHKRWGSARPT